MTKNVLLIEEGIEYIEYGDRLLFLHIVETRPGRVALYMTVANNQADADQLASTYGQVRDTMTFRHGLETLRQLLEFDNGGTIL